MRFDRKQRYEGYAWTNRKRLAAANQPQRERAKLQKTHPLIAEQLAVAPALPEAEELAKRQQHAKSLVQGMRDLEARHWRTGRAAYFACDPDMRQRIREEWLAWRGPAKGVYFIYVVEKHNGAAATRAAVAEEERRALRASIRAELAAAETLPLF